MKGGYVKTGYYMSRGDKSIVIKLNNNDIEELFLDSIVTIKINR